MLLSSTKERIADGLAGGAGTRTPVPASPGMIYPRQLLVA
jgi:hypothetical protein